jgi:hypothetical protein
MRGERCWGVYREEEFSPDRVNDDAEILRATARRLERLGFTVELKTPEEVAGADDGSAPAFLFVMCQAPSILARLRGWEARGSLQVNSAAAIRQTHREQTLALWERHGVPFPETVVVSTSDGAVPGPLPCWVKRADVHHQTGNADVVFAGGPEAARQALAEQRSRGIERALLQAHVSGDLIKFYGVNPAEPGSWFTWFYHRDQELSGYRFSAPDLARAAARSALALDLEVYGGDAIAAADGRITIIDVNAWPSFALFRAEASERIAAYLAARFRKDVAAAR